MLVVGEALVDVVRRGGVSEAHPGGSPLNVAVGVQRLGLDATLHSRFGRDRHGLAVAAHLAASGVAVTPGTITREATSVAVATIGSDGAAQYDFAISWDPAPLDVAAFPSRALHVGSIGSWLEPGASLVEDLVRATRPHATITFDPNVRPALMPTHAEAVSRVERFVRLADVVKASDEDLEWLYPGTDPAVVLDRWLGFGPALVIATGGAAGADSVTRNGHLHTPAPKITVADTIGAGDSFMAGLIAGLDDEGLLGKQRRDELRDIPASSQRYVVELAARCAAVTTTRIGANPPTRSDILAFWR
ncbi:MAG: carbohydrate kinase [Rhodoglobus sp.]|nr:carbohydrate kinase [Rhodoglobus sp.]